MTKQASLPSIDTSLPLMEAFYTLQGEGFHQGKAAYFIRLAGCPVGCVWCDVKESWDETKHEKKTVRQIIKAASTFPKSIAVVTGGEPCMHDLHALTFHLKKNSFATHLETSGACPITGNWDWICLSPKKFQAPLEENIALAHELKVVIYNKSDFNWAEKYAAKVNTSCQLFLQPEWSKEKKMLPLIIAYIQENPTWALSMQLHKYLQLP